MTKTPPLSLPDDMAARCGSDLCQEDREAALQHFQGRYTREHVPDWAKEPRPDGGRFRVQFESDAEWLENTWFRVTAGGRLDRTALLCHPAATWPDNPELRKP